MRRAALLSAILHVVVVLFAWLGLPKLMLTPPEPERPIIVELVTIGDKTNPPPAPVEQLKQDQPAPEPPKPEPAKSAPPPPPAPAPPPPPVAVAEPLPAPKPKEKPPEPKPEPKPEPPKPSPLSEVKPKPRPEPPPDDFANVLKTVEKLKNQPPPDDFDKMLKKLAQPQPQQPQPQAPPAKPAAPAGSPASNLNEKFTISEEDFIRRHIQKNWNPPVGAKEAVIVTMSFTIRPDGTFYDLRFENERASDALWRSFADSARRALLLSSPIPLPPGKIRGDERFVFNFDPREMMGFSSKAR
jgi:outer membrane biosynthesis protein TonB